MMPISHPRTAVLTSLVCALALLSLGTTLKAEAESPPALIETATESAPVKNTPPCADEIALGQRLEQRLQQVTGTRDRLVVFVSGQQLPDLPPAALFTVNLLDPEAVKRRVAELQSYTPENRDGLTEQSRELLRCAEAYPALTPQVQRLQDLENQINALRLQFLSLPQERRNALVKSQEAALRHQDTAEELARERGQAQEQQLEAKRSIEAAEEAAKTAISSGLRSLATQRALLEKTREELAAVQVRLTTQLEARSRAHQQAAERLSQVASEYTRYELPRQLGPAYNTVAQIWRELVDDIFKGIADSERYIALPKLPTLPVGLLQNLSDSPATGEYQAAYAEVRKAHERLSALREKRFKEERDNYYRLLLESSQLRSELLQANLDVGNTAPVVFNEAYFSDLLRELRIVPYRWIALAYTKLLELRHKLDSGLSGFIDIIKQLGMFVLLVLIPFVTYRLLRALTEALNRFRQKLVQHQATHADDRHAYLTALALLIQRTNLYLPWIMMLLALWVADGLLAHTDLAEIAAVLPYIAYYVAYRIFVNLITSLFRLVATKAGGLDRAVQRLRLHKTAREIGLFFLIALIIAHATQDVVGEALIYRIVAAAMLYLGVLVCAHAARRWRVEIAAAAEKVLPDKLADRLSTVCLGGLSSWFACLPTLALVLAAVIATRLRVWAGQFDFAKRVGAELFRRKVEGAVGKGDKETPPPEPTSELPEDYLRWFSLNAPDDSSLLIKPSSGVMEKVNTIVQRWMDHGGDNALAIYGDKGGGKSCLLRLIAESSHPCEVLHLTVPPKIWTKKDLHDFLAAHLHVEVDPEVTTDTKDEAPQRKLILLDEAHNLFLAQPGGFAAYREFLDIIVATAASHFWVTAFNRHSWNYLKGVFGNTLGIRLNLLMPPLPDSDLRQLIMARHHRTKYRLSYDTIIRATQNPDEAEGAVQIEAQFFRLLWGQSKGNPRAGLVLWLSSIHLGPDGRLIVSIPQTRTPKELENLGSDGLFVYAAVMRHENLSMAEVVSVTNLAPAVVRNALRYGVENRFLFFNEAGRYRVTPTAQLAVVHMLLGRNYLHE